MREIELNRDSPLSIPVVDAERILGITAKEILPKNNHTNKRIDDLIQKNPDYTAIVYETKLFLSEYAEIEEIRYNIRPHFKKIITALLAYNRNIISKINILLLSEKKHQELLKKYSAILDNEASHPFQ